MEAKEKRLAVEEKQQSAHEKTIKSELEWIRANPKGRQSKSKARIARFEELNSQSFQSRNETQELYIPPGTRLGDKVLEVKNLSKGFGSKSLIENLNFSLPKGSILGIVGGNGAGKTTFLRMLVSSEKPDSGTIELGETVKLAYVDQSRDELDGEKTVVFIGLNPSEADSVNNDRTLIRIINFCSRWNYKNIYVINLFGLISKSPLQLSKSNDPIGENNDLITLKSLEFWRENNNCDLWLGWGDKGQLNGRDLKVLKLIKNFSNLKSNENNYSKRVLSLGLSKKGNPRHPLYMPNKSFLRRFDL